MASPNLQDLPPTPVEVSTFIEGGKVIFRDDSGHAFYISDKDPPGHSDCEDACALMWWPLKAQDGAKPLGKWTLVTRKDGSKQWAYKGKPVYSFAHDNELGKDKGDGAGNGAWHTLKP